MRKNFRLLFQYVAKVVEQPGGREDSNREGSKIAKKTW